MKADSQEAFSDLKHDEAAIMSPGVLLRDRRLALHLNEWDIAREMRLQTQYILDLEADNFDAFSSLAFVRGYLRGYAKLVGVSESDVMQLFNQLSLQDKVATGVPRYITRDRRHGDRYWRWMGLGVIAFIAISLVLWWQNYNSNIKTLNTSVDTTLSQVSTLQKSLQAENTAAQTPATSTVATPDQVGGALGASADLLNSTTTTNSSTSASATASAQNTTAMPATPMAVVPASNANVATNPTTMVPANNATTASPAPGGTADSTTTTNTTTPAFKPKRKRAQSQSDLSSAHAPIVDGQAPRLGEN